MGIITLPTTFVDGTVPTAAQFNGDFSAIVNEFNGSISSANVDSTIVTASASQTLSNKILTKPTINGSLQGISSYSPSAAGTATLDLSTANIHFITMPAGNITIAVSNASVGQCFAVRILQDSGGSRTVTWFSTIKWAGGSAPTLTTTASKADMFAFICTSANNYDGFIVGKNL